MNETPVKDIPCNTMTVNELMKALYDAGGFSAKKVATGVNILETMVKDRQCTRFLSFPACICATGTRGVIRELLKRKLFDVVITTAGTLDHDLARIWKNYYHGSFMVDDRALHKEGVNRLGNIFIPNECYGAILEEKMQPILENLYKRKKTWSTKDLIWEFGNFVANEEKGKDSILYWAWKNKIPIYVPGITDGAFGSQLWMYYQEHRDFMIDLLQDEQELSDIVFDAKKTGALIIGGGISKHHTIWWNQFKDGLDHVVYITTAVEYDGSLSGAQTREAISWGKVKEQADNVTIEGDATVLLPLMTSALFERL
ncbi:MAG: deoxyhypusine synthase [Candidatus Thermoplasmatota archaeon]|nr:deoxyhypusine synthase [Candidatus Thermoplasmatota archaeon]